MKDRARRRRFAPEVVQTSAMDCGPAALKCLLEGFGIPVSYGRLREACQTDVDGTSIDTLEEVACRLGLEAEQVMLPLDHLLVEEAAALPAIVVVRIANGLTHFVVAWRRHGRVVQLMDPATGRRFTTRRAFLDEVYLHTQAVAASTWREWAAGDDFGRVLARRLGDLGISDPGRLIDRARGADGWRSLAGLDAATRLVASLTGAGALATGREAQAVLERFHARVLSGATATAAAAAEAIPAAYWSVRPIPSEDGVERLALRGAVLVRVLGRRTAASAAEASPLPPELARALAEKPSSPARDLVRLLLRDGRKAPLGAAVATIAAASTLVAEALLFRGFIDLGRDLGLSGQRFAAAAAILFFLAASLLVRLPLMAAVLRLGRHLEVKLRTAFLDKLPRLGDRYFGSRLTSDMAERAHALHRLRALPQVAAEAISDLAQLAFTAAGVIWLAPQSLPLVLLAVAAAVGLPLLAQPVLVERDLRVRNHGGALARFHLDALLGLVAVRTHGAERAVRREHEALLVTWARAGLALLHAAVAVEGLVFLAGFGLVAFLLFDHLARGGGAGSVLLLVYWALGVPVLGERLGLAVRQYPGHRNTMLRVLEPLGAPDEIDAAAPAPAAGEPTSATSGPAIAISAVTVRATGHVILADIDLAVAAGEHVAIVGPSGAGKSSLLGLLLGWHHPASGSVAVDGMRLDPAALERLRRETAWLDPTVQLWNRSLLDNLRYGAGDDPRLPIGWALETSSLRPVLEKLPDGLQTALGESGGLVSGGEGQRVRLGRALLRRPVRLAVLDEPFRGLDRGARRDLLERVRRIWREATLLCVTHDIAETLGFPRVLVLADGRIVEDGRPEELARDPTSRYRVLLEAERDVRERLWSGPQWRHLRLEDGRTREAPGVDA